MIVYEPLHAALEAGQAIHDFRLQGFHGEKGNKAHHRTNLEVVLAAIRQAENVVVKTVLVVPQSHAVYTDVVHGMSDVDEMLEEFASHVFVSHVFFCEFQSNGEHVEAVHAHPTGAVGLLEMAARGKRGGTVEDSDVIEPEEAALENVGAVGILAIHPPGEVQKQFMKDFFEESAVGNATHAALNFVNPPRGPRVHGRVHVTESPFVRRQLPVGVHVPFTKQKNELLFSKIGIDQSDGTMLHFSCRITLGMDIRNLFELQGSFESNRIIDASAEIKRIGPGNQHIRDFRDLPAVSAKMER